MNVIIASQKNKLITIEALPGHFTTSNIHVSHYLDMSRLKSNALAARDAARELASPYLSSELVDTIVCMEGTETIGAYLAEELIQDGSLVINSDHEIYVVTPTSNINGQLMFHQSVLKNISNRHILLLVASVSSGRTVRRALECLGYYGGILTGISSIFSAKAEVDGNEIHTLFSDSDIEGYMACKPSECIMCRQGQKLDAIVNSDGYTKI